MNQLNTTLFVQESLPTQRGRSNTELLRLVSQSRSAQPTASATALPVLRMRWVYSNDETLHPILRARWQMVAQA